MLPALFFSADVEHAHALAAALKGHGVNAHAISGRTPKDERRELIDAMRKAQIDALCSCEVISTGFDCPVAMAAFMVRPTLSGLWYRQAVGRILRPFPAPQGDRQYQTEALRAICHGIKDGCLNQLLVLPTGTGKTRIATNIPKAVQWWKKNEQRGRIIFFVHRDELAQQAADAFAAAHCGTVGVEKADSHANGAAIVIASTQTLGTKTGLKRLEAFNPDQFDAIIQDEAHWATESQYFQQIFAHFRVAKNGSRDSGKLLLGLTATPNRADNVGLENYYDKIIYTYPLTKAIKEKWLTKIIAHRVETRIDISAVQARNGEYGKDFVPGQLTRTINTSERNEITAQKYLEICRLENMTGPVDLDNWVKPHSVLVDFVDITRHRLITAPTLCGLNPNYNPNGNSITDQAERIADLSAQYPGADFYAAPNMEGIEATLKRINVLAVPNIPEEIVGYSDLAWIRDAPDSYHLGLSDHSFLAIRQNALGKWEVWQRPPVGFLSKTEEVPSLQQAIRSAETYVTNKDRNVLNTSGRWRSEPPTQIQATRLWMLDWKIRKEWNSDQKFFRYCQGEYQANRGYTKGDLSNMINARSRA